MTPEKVDAPRTSALGSLRRPPRWLLAAMAAALLVTLSVGAAIGRARVDPTATQEYVALQQQLTTVTSERDASRDAAQDARDSFTDSAATVARLKAQIDELEAASGDLADREAAVKEREDDVAQRETDVARAEGELEAKTIYAGTYIVGEDIKPGTYRSKGGDGCYWARLRDLRGELGSIIANDLSLGGPSVVTIRSSDKAFETQGCEAWVRQS